MASPDQNRASVLERRRRKRLAHVAAYKRSGLTGREYAERHDLSLSTLWSWVGRAKREQSNLGRGTLAHNLSLKCVGEVGDLLASSTRPLAKLRLACGSELEISIDARVDQIEAILMGARICLG